MNTWKNRSYAGKISQAELGKTVSLYGWVDAVRDHGQLLFIHLRDISGVIQIVFDPEKNREIYSLAEKLRSEFVLAVSGVVIERATENRNPHIPTGHLEIAASHLEILNKAETPPFIVSEKDMFGASTHEAHHVDEDVRLAYRYLDLRRPSMQSNLVKRAQVYKVIRDYLVDASFIEVETPVLTKSTPEGARDYLVPSRTHGGEFYALPQSPQLFKQLLMMSGLDRYFQIVKCFRDEDLRPNRQPEFTQLDLEASFIDEEFVYQLIEGLIQRIFSLQNTKLVAPFPRMRWDEAMNRYGSENPDLRYDLPLIEVTDILKNSGYKIFKTIVEKGGVIKGIALKGQAQNLSKNVLQNDLAMTVIPKLGGKGMTWMKLENGELQSNIVQFFTPAELEQLTKRLGGEDGDVLVFVADTNPDLVNKVLGKFRVYIAERQGLVDRQKICPVWITDFPLFEEKDGHISSTHHPFTSPNASLPGKDDRKALLGLRARAYDLVINGEEVGGGSIRIHNSDIQRQIFDILGLSAEEIDSKFGFFVRALKFGAPPHGGLALGIDRLVSMLLGTDSIREVIAFPKNRVAFCPLTSAPSGVSEKQLLDLSLSVKLPKKL